jgi:hypothetical protein
MAITFTTTMASAVAGEYSVTVGEAVEIVNRSLITRDHSPQRVKDAIEHAVNHALRETHCNAKIYGFETEEGVTGYDLDTALEGVNGARVLGAWCGNRVLEGMDWREILRKREEGEAAGMPRAYGGRLASEVMLHPVPDGVYSLEVKAWSACVSLESDSTVINVGREFLMAILRNGAAALVSSNAPDGRGGLGWTQFLRDDLASIKRACYGSRVLVKSGE